MNVTHKSCRQKPPTLASSTIWWTASLRWSKSSAAWTRPRGSCAPRPARLSVWVSSAVSPSHALQDYTFEQKTEELRLFVSRSNSLKVRIGFRHEGTVICTHVADLHVCFRCTVHVMCLQRCHLTPVQAILSTVPDVIGDRPKFLAMIRDIATAIKDLLDSFNDAVANNGLFLRSSPSPPLTSHPQTKISHPTKTSPISFYLTLHRCAAREAQVRAREPQA